MRTLEELRKAQQPITDAVDPDGIDHPSKVNRRRGQTTSGRRTPPRHDGSSPIGELIPESARRKLSALQGKLEGRRAKGGRRAKRTA